MLLGLDKLLGYTAVLNKNSPGFAGSVYQYTVSVVSKNHTVQPLAAVYWYITVGLKILLQARNILAS